MSSNHDVGVDGGENLGFEVDQRVVDVLNNDSSTEDERQQLLKEQQKAEDAAELRDEDYQLAYAIDILKGLNALGPVD